MYFHTQQELSYLLQFSDTATILTFFNSLKYQPPDADCARLLDEGRPCRETGRRKILHECSAVAWRKWGDDYNKKNDWRGFEISDEYRISRSRFKTRSESLNDHTMAPYENEELFTADYCTYGLSGDI